MFQDKTLTINSDLYHFREKITIEGKVVKNDPREQNNPRTTP